MATDFFRSHNRLQLMRAIASNCNSSPISCRTVMCGVGTRRFFPARKLQQASDSQLSLACLFQPRSCDSQLSKKMFSSATLLSSKLRKALAQLPYLPRALKLVWEVARPWTSVWIVLLIVQGLLPAASVYLTKLVVDGVVVALRNGGSWPEMRQVLTRLLLLGGVLLLMEVVRNVINWVRTVQAE